MKNLFKIIVFVLITSNTSFSQDIMSLIPAATATHTAVANGSWFSAATWSTGTVPASAAIVYIPEDITVNYDGESDEHIFAIRVDGNFACEEMDAEETTTLTFDTFIGTGTSIVTFYGDELSNGNIDVTIKPFDIEAHKAGTSGYPLIWNADAIAHYSDGALTFMISQEVGPDSRFNSYEEALEGETDVTELSREPFSDGVGVLGRYNWDTQQHSVGMVVMGETEIIGREKLNMSKLSMDALKDQPEINVEDLLIGWEIGDEILVTRGGNMGALSNGEDVRTIESIVGTTITFTDDLNRNHEGRPGDTLHCFAGNLTRNIVFKSAVADTIHQRGHFMAMHNSENVQIRNAEFIDMGRTDKSRLLDDFIWNNWLEPKVFNSKISALGQECAEMVRNPDADVTNTRGRYSIHLHKTGTTLEDSMVYVTGNVVRGNPGWGITHHDSYADVSNNIVYEVVGAGIVSESGSEIGFWDNNLVVDIQSGHNTDKYDAVLFHDDYLYSGQGLAMKGRAVVCRGNVIVNAKEGVGIINMNPSINNLDRIDSKALAAVRPGYEIDQFPLSSNGYSSEGNGVMPVEVALIMENTTVISCNRGLRSIERDMGVNHESRSVFDGFVAWGVNQGLSITYQADYSFKNVYISGKNMSSIGAYLWKHSHNHVFENIKMVDLGYGITVSKLVYTGSEELKTRNNGYTSWYFIDLETDNVTDFYQIIKEDPADIPDYIYEEHGDNPIHMNSEDFVEHPTSFTILDSTEMYVDYASGDLRFEIDGVIADNLGTYDMGIKQAWAQGTLRLDYPQRIYEFADTDKFEEFLTENGVYKDTANDDQLYFIINEWLPNRLTYEYTSFPIRIKIENAPDAEPFTSASIEDPSMYDPQNHVISRLASVTQSSTKTTVMYDTASIAVPAERAIDGNNNGRIIAQYYQQWLVPVGSFSETNVELEPWYDMDLGELKTIEYIDIWNTVELNGSDIEIPSDHFKDFYVLVSDSAFGDLSLSEAIELSDYQYLKDGTTSRKFSINDMDADGRYIRIQGIGSTKIKLAEVEAIGRKYVDVCEGVIGGTEVVTSCGEYTWIDDITYTESGLAEYTYITVDGCDSTVTLDLTINNVDISVLQDGLLLTSNAVLSTYQWANCDDGYAIIDGATEQNYIADENGNYAAIVTTDGCTDTSACYEINSIGLNELSNVDINAYPSPSTGNFSVDLSQITEPFTITVYTQSGKLLYSGLYSHGNVIDFELNLATGKYLILVRTDDSDLSKWILVTNN